MIVEWKKRENTKEMRTAERGSGNYSGVMLVRIQGIDRGEPYGEIIHLNLIKPVPYQSLAELVFRIDGIIRFLGISDGSIPYRSVRGTNAEGNSILPEEYCKVIPTEQRARDGFCRGFHLKKAQEIVCVEILGTSYVSLQGRMKCRQTGEKYVYFRSGMELMYLFSGLQQDMDGMRFAKETLDIDKN